MAELAKRLERLFLKLDHTALLVEQTLADALFAVENGNDEDAEVVIHSDKTIDRREVETERECIRLLALYQPAAVVLRRICFVVKANSDLERIADYCVKIAKRSRRLKREGIAMTTFPAFYTLAEEVGETLRQTIKLFTLRQEEDQRDMTADGISGMDTAYAIIAKDKEVLDVVFREYLEQAIQAEAMFHGRLKTWYELCAQGRSLERIGDLCANIAQDAVFMISGEIIRHGGAAPEDSE